MIKYSKPAVCEGGLKKENIPRASQYRDEVYLDGP